MNPKALSPIEIQREIRSASARLRSFMEQTKGDIPRVLVVIGAYRGMEELEKTLNAIPEDMLPLIHEIAVFDVFSAESVEEAFETIRSNPAAEKLKYFRTPKPYHYGENLKNSFDYAIEKGFDYVLALRGDGAYDPSCLPLFLDAALISNCRVVIGDRTLAANQGPKWSVPYLRRLGNRALSAAEEFLLRIGLRDYHCGYRLISTKVLKRIPYSLNVADYLFDLHTLIQFRCLGIDICAVPVPDFHDMSVRFGQTVRDGLRALKISLGYRLHQLHVIRRAVYFVDMGENYTLKRNRHSSHMQILNSLKPGAMVLDVGCGRSLLAEEYARRGITLVGVDSIPEEKVSEFASAYFRQDLEQPLSLPYGRVFDYIILSDVIEHLVNRDALMSALRRHLKPDGRLIASTGNVAIWFYRVSLLLGRFEYGPRGILDRTHVHLFTLDSFKRFFLQKGYHVLDVKYTPIPFELLFSSTGRSPAVEGITNWYHWLSRVWPRMFAYQFITYAAFRSYESAMGEEEWPEAAGGHSERVG